MPLPRPISTRRAAWLAAAALTVLAAAVVYGIRQQTGQLRPDAVQSFLILPFATTGSGVDGIDLGSTHRMTFAISRRRRYKLRVIGRRTALCIKITH